MANFYDSERIIEDADVVNVAEYLDMEMSRSGSVIRIKCPGHFKRLGKEDNNFGSCMLTEKGYHCFACQVSVGLIDMVEEVKGCSYVEALGIIADANGGRENYIVSGEYKMPIERTVKVLSDEDLKLIGLKSNICFDEYLFPDGDKEYIKNCHYNISFDLNDLDAPYYIASKNKSVSIKSLKIKNERLYNTIIKNAAKAAMQKYQDAITNFAKDGKNVNLFKPFGEINEEIIYDFKLKFSQMYQRSKEIYDEIDEKTCISELLDKEPEKVIIPKYDLFD